VRSPKPAATAAQRRLWAAVAVVACLSTIGCTRSPAVLFDDEFTGSRGQPPPANWSYDLGNRGWGNHERETYTARRANTFLDGSGHLVIRAVRQPDGTWTSARLVTRGHFSHTYGVFAARIKFASGAGMWPAFWLLGEHGEADGEIDVTEKYGNGTWGDSSSSVFGEHDTRKRSTGDTHAGTGWHVWTMTWSATAITFAEDGRPLLTVGKFAGWPDRPMYLILNLAVGGSGGGPVPASTRSAEMLVDWVRVTQ
jgi:beta-glucanase (GH16 family)